MDELERLDRWHEEVDARRREFLDHVAGCKDCRADLQRVGAAKVRCPEVGRLVRAYDAAHELLAEALAAALR